MRRKFRIASAGALLLLAMTPTASSDADKKQVAAVVSVWHQNAHADVIVGRLLEGYTLDGQGEKPSLELVALYTDQVPETDKSRALAAKYNVPIYDSVAGALTRGTGKLAVDGVLLVAEHGKYPTSPTGQVQYPKRRLFEQVAAVFEAAGRSVPVFIDKHLADNWTDAKWIYDTARRLNVPLMAGSSVPSLWRYPPVDVERGARLSEVTGVSYHTLDAYGFHGMEMLQCLAERRMGGETGVRAVECYEKQAVWDAARQGVFDTRLLDAALARLKQPRGGDRPLAERVPEPVLFHIEYADGLKANLLTLNGAVAEWAAAWRYADGERVDSTLFDTQEARPFMHFTFQLQGVEKMMHTGRPTWPVERTLLTSGLLDALLISKQQGGARLETPYLAFSYTTDWNSQQPPPRPPDRPINGQ